MFLPTFVLLTLLHCLLNNLYKNYNICCILVLLTLLFFWRENTLNSTSSTLIAWIVSQFCLLIFIHHYHPYFPLSLYVSMSLVFSHSRYIKKTHFMIILILLFDIFNQYILTDCSCIENCDEIKDLPNYKFVCGNICSPELVKYVLETEKIDTIMHFAAQTHVDNSFGNSFQFTQNNIMGTHVMLESAKDVGIKRFIHVSTDEVYGEQSLDQAAMDEEQVGTHTYTHSFLSFYLFLSLTHTLLVL